jgi:alpha-ketoglutarate-dependent 2,4-dichlorophenoxyacetate dioxygenase
MAVTIYPVTPTFAAEIGDVDLSGRIDPADLLTIKEAFARYAVLIFPDQHLSQNQHLACATRSSTSSGTPRRARRRPPHRDDGAAGQD